MSEVKNMKTIVIVNKKRFFKNNCADSIPQGAQRDSTSIRGLLPGLKEI